MARPKKNMSLTKVHLDGQQAARKRFKITFGKALQNAPGRLPRTTTAGSEPKPAIRLPAPPRPVSHTPSTPTPPAADFLAKASENMPVVKTQSGITDKPAAALIKDLKQRGLLEDTLVVWGGEFGRTPTAEGTDGREHHPFGFTMWLAGGGIKGGMAYGATDEFGWHAIDNKVHVHDLHATILHLMGINHEKLTYRYSGRDFRLTDVAGRVVTDILA